MPTGFSAVRATDPLAERTSRLAPGNPFQTVAYLHARQALGEQAWVLTSDGPDGAEHSCFGYMKTGWLNTVLDIPSLAAMPHGSPFWCGLQHFCRAHGVTELCLGTMGSPGASIPPWPCERERIARTEFAFDLRPDDLLSGMSKGHRERIKKGCKRGLTVRRGRGDGMLDAHIALHVNSMQRRRERGEHVPEEFPRDVPAALLQTGAGELFQAVLDDRVLSSLLVISSERGAYSESSGNSPEGMTLGASHFLRYETALALRAEGVEMFYLGGARPHEAGLWSYKEGFGAVPLPMESVEVYLGSLVRRKVTTTVALFRANPATFWKTLAGEVERYVTYVIDPRTVTPPPVPEGWVLSKLSDEELAALPDDPTELRVQKVRIARGRVNDAYAVHIDGILAGICWLIPSEHDRRYAVRNVKLGPGEAEITHCVTVPAFRGRGIYPFMIRTLCTLAAGRGIHRVFMITNRKNMVSQRGILRAGLQQTGGIYRHSFPYLGDVAVTIRRHRWGPFGWR